MSGAETPPLPPRPHGGYRAIYADPCWDFSNFSQAGEAKNPKAHYACMSLEALAEIPVPYVAASNSALFMWATFPMLREGLALMEAWGFEYKTGGAWAKQSSTGRKLAFGTGYIFRSAAEILLVGTRGAPAWLSRSERNLWLAPIREHSRKPDEVRAAIERLTPGPRLELFARQTAPGWTAWGNEVGKFARIEAATGPGIASPDVPDPLTQEPHRPPEEGTGGGFRLQGPPDQ